MNIQYVNTQQNQVGAVGKIVTDTANKKLDEKNAQNDTAVVVNLSKQGLLMNQNQRSTIDEENVISHMEKNQGEVVTKRSLESIIEDVRNGKELSAEDREQLNRELEEMINGRFDEMRNKKLSAEDERVLKELKNSYMMRQRSLQDLKKNLEKEKIEAELEESSVEQTQKMEDAEEKKDLVESLFEDLEEKEASTEKEEDENEETEVADSVNGEINKENTESEEKDIAVTKARSEQLQANLDNLKQLNEEKGRAMHDEKFYANRLKEEHKIAIDTIKDDNLTNLDKVNQYEHFMEISKDLMESREIARNIKIYNHRAAVDLKMAIRSNGSVSLAEFMLGKKTKSQAGREFINKM